MSESGYEICEQTVSCGQRCHMTFLTNMAIFNSQFLEKNIWQ
jgi:hypothetical protein